MAKNYTFKIVALLCKISRSKALFLVKYRILMPCFYVKYLVLCCFFVSSHPKYHRYDWQKDIGIHPHWPWERRNRGGWSQDEDSARVWMEFGTRSVVTWILRKQCNIQICQGQIWHRWGIHAPWGKCLAHLALWMIPRSIPVRRWSWRTDAPSSLSWMNACGSFLEHDLN